MFKKNPLWSFSIVLIIRIACLATPFILYFFEAYILIFFIAGIILGIVSFAGIIELAYIIIPETKFETKFEQKLDSNHVSDSGINSSPLPQSASGPDFFDKIKLALLYLTKLALFVFFFFLAAKNGINAIIFFIAGFSVIIPALLLAGMRLKPVQKLNNTNNN